MNRTSTTTTRSMRADHKVRKMRQPGADSKRGQQARAQGRARRAARRAAVALPLALVALALPLAPVGPHGAAQAATGGMPAGNPVRLAGANAAPDYLRVLSANRVVHLPKVCRTEKHVYPRYGGASQQFRDRLGQSYWATIRGKALAGYDPANGDLYTWQPVILACWRS